MKVRLIRIRNSQGILIPKPLLEQAGLQGLVIHALGHSRAGWDEAFQAMSRQGDDALLDDDALQR